MRSLIGLILGVIVTVFVVAGIITLFWWLFVVAAIVGVAGFVWRTVTRA